MKYDWQPRTYCVPINQEPLRAYGYGYSKHLTNCGASDAQFAGAFWLTPMETPPIRTQRLATGARPGATA